MRKLITVVAVATVLVSCVKQGKYTITNANGSRYQAESYTTTGDGCILFNDKNCGCGDVDGPGTPTRLCGSYTIVENKVEQ
jgi:hypothetical protein